MIYLDASLIVAAIAVEAASPAVCDWLSEREPDNLVVSDWALTETSAALAFKVRTGQIDKAMKADAERALAGMLADSLIVIPVPSEAYAHAGRYFDDSSIVLRGSDALHVAITQLADCRLATLDRQMGAAAERLGITVINIS